MGDIDRFREAGSTRAVYDDCRKIFNIAEMDVVRVQRDLFG